MSRIKAIIYTSSNIENDLVFENEDILAISTNTKCIENENLPEFDIFPNSGTLTVKDRNLDIYNKAINGFFDNYEYKVKYSLEEQIIATHIINQRPRYDYDAKTCTFYLGNKLDKLSNQTFTSYVYPLESQTLYDIFKEVLRKIFSITDTDIDTVYTELMNNVWGNSSVTFADYFKQININYPYISQTNSREALKTILLIAQCGMYLDKNNKLKLIRLDGYSNASADEYYNNVYKIEPRHINKGFVPSVILDNRFNKFDLDKYDVTEIVTNNDDILNDTVNNSNNLSNYLTEITQDTLDDDTNLLKDKSSFVVNANDIGSQVSEGNYRDWYIFALTKQNVDNYSFLNYGNRLYINFNYNLNQILNVNKPMVEDYNGELSISNPSINLIYEKETITSKGYFTGLKYNPNDVDLAPAKNWVFVEREKLSDTTETVSLFPLSGEDKNNYSITVGNVPINLECSTNINRNNVSEITKDITSYRGAINILAEKQISYYYGTFFKYGSSIPYSSSSSDTEEFAYLSSDDYLSHITKITTTYTLQQIEITYKGLTKKITFNKNVFSKGTNFAYNLQSNLELNQDTSSINGSSTQDSILSNLLNTFNGGLHTGTLTVANTNYNFVNPVYEEIPQEITLNAYTWKDNPLSVSKPTYHTITTTAKSLFDKINGVTLTPNKDTIVFSGKHEVFISYNENSSYNKNVNIDLTIKAKTIPEKNQTIITQTFDVGEKHYYFYVGEHSITGITRKLKETNKQIFEIGDKVMPYKDKPIINRVNNGVEEPVVFQIVDCETFNESGATFQNLVLREIKKPPIT